MKTKKLTLNLETVKSLEHVAGGARRLPKTLVHSANPSCGIICIQHTPPLSLPTDAHSLHPSCAIICRF